MSAQYRRRKAKKKKNVNQRRLAFVAIVTVLVIYVLYSFVHSIALLTSKRVYEGITLNGTEIAGMNEAELRKALPTMAEFSNVYDITIEAEGVSEKISTLSLVPTPDVDSMIAAAMGYGRTKSGLARLGEISDLKKNPVNIPYMLTFDEHALQQTLDKISDKLGITATDNKIQIGSDSITITRGVPGRGIVYADVKNAISQCLLAKNNTVTLSLTDINPEEITVDFIERHTFREPEDATYTIQNHRLVFTESHPGITLDDGDVKRAIKKASGQSQFSVPAKIKQPKVSTESLRNSILGDVLGTFSSDFSSSSKDRADNIRLACNKINGYVLAPGEEFSYNTVVGPRTEEFGFKMANVYVGNTVQPGIGGGICQVSSTMFNAVVYADLEITERRNHTLPVTYVPMGRDATVSFDFIDFKFKNTYPTPIEISATCEGRKNVVTIRGVNNHPERKIEIEAERTATTEPDIVQKYDSTLEEGKVKVEEAGSKGSSYVAYKIVYENGVQVSKDVLCRSTYKGVDRVEIIGTKKKPEPTKTPEPEPTSKPSASPKPSATPKPTKTPAPSSKPEGED